MKMGMKKVLSLTFEDAFAQVPGNPRLATLSEAVKEKLSRALAKLE